MRIALLSDIHGNREALAACLDHARRTNVGRFVFLGDYVGYGADPGWVVDTVAAEVERGAVAVLGNHDAAVLSASRRRPPRQPPRVITPCTGRLWDNMGYYGRQWLRPV